MAADPNCDFALRDIVEAREFHLAYYCAEQQLTADPENIDAMLVLARAAQELGQMERADELAKTARTYPLTTGQRFAAYLISGMAQAFVPMQGSLYAIASRNTSPNGSKKDGKANTEDS